MVLIDVFLGLCMCVSAFSSHSFFVHCCSSFSLAPVFRMIGRL